MCSFCWILPPSWSKWRASSRSTPRPTSAAGRKSPPDWWPVPVGRGTSPWRNRSSTTSRWSWPSWCNGSFPWWPWPPWYRPSSWWLWWNWPSFRWPWSSSGWFRPWWRWSPFWCCLLRTPWERPSLWTPWFLSARLWRSWSVSMWRSFRRFWYRSSVETDSWC